MITAAARAAAARRQNPAPTLFVIGDHRDAVRWVAEHALGQPWQRITAPHDLYARYRGVLVVLTSADVTDPTVRACITAARSAGLTLDIHDHPHDPPE